MAEEFVTALIKFVADDRDFIATADSIVERAKKAAKAADDAFRESFRRAGGEGASFAPQIDEGATGNVASFNESLSDTEQAAREANSATEDLNEITEKTGQTTRRTGAEFRHGTVLTRELSRSLLRDLSPALGGVISEMASAARGASRMGLGFGLAIGLGIAAASILGKMAEAAKEAAEQNVKLALALRFQDAGVGLGVITELIGKQEKLIEANKTYSDSTRTSNVPFFDFIARTQAGLELLFTNQTKLRVQTERTRDVTSALLNLYEIPKATLESQKALLSAKKAVIDSALQEVGTASEINRLGDENIKLIGEETAAQVQLLRIQSAKNVAALIGRGLYNDAAKLAVAAAVQVTAAELEGATKVKDAQRAKREAAAEAAAAAIESAASIEEAESKARAATTAGILQVMEAERALQEARAIFNGQNIHLVETTIIKRRALTEQQFAEEKRQQEERFSGGTAALRVRIDAASGKERLKLETDLQTHLIDLDAARTKLAADQSAKRIQQAQQEADERQKAAEQRAKVRGFGEIRDRLAGGLGFDTEFDNLRKSANDADLSAETRLQARVTLRARQQAIDEGYFSLLRNLGLASLKDEVQRDAEKVAQYKRGTQERLDAEISLSAKLKQLRDAAASAGETLIQRAAASLQAQGITDATLADLKAEADKLQRAATDLLRGLGTGGNVDLSKLSESFGIAKEVGKRSEIGVSAGEAAGAALSRAGEQLSGQAPEAGSIFSVDQAKSFNAEEGFRRLYSAATTSFEQMGTAADKFINEFQKKIDTGTARIAQSIFDNFMDRLVRRLADESTRQ